MRFFYTTFIGLLSVLFVSSVFADQTIHVTNLLDNANDSYPSRTQTPVKLDIYSGSKICYTQTSLSFGDTFLVKGSSTDPYCTYISQIVVTPLTVLKLQIYGPASTVINIPGAPSTITQISVIQKAGAENAPVFNEDGTLKTMGTMDYLMGSGLDSTSSPNAAK
jgi:hypothetical protein